jgi:Carboxypeptidase regulatory-like domain
MQQKVLGLSALAVVLLFSTMAFAGAPLKGVDVKLGSNPGGTAAQLKTNEQGDFSFGVVAKGNYSVIIKFIVLKPKSLRMAPHAAEVVLRGVVGGEQKVSVPPGTKSGVLRKVLSFTADGVHAVTGHISESD